MKKRLDFWNLGWALMALLVLASVFLMGETSDQAVSPDPTSYKLGGLAAFTELLHAAGYETSVERSSTLHLKQGDLVVACKLNDLKAPAAVPVAEASQKSVQEWVTAGGSALWLQMDTKIQDPKELKVLSFPGSAKPPTAVSVFLQDQSPETPEGAESFRIGNLENGNATAQVVKRGDGLEMYPLDGYMALNDGIGRADNARVLLRLVGMIAKPGGRIVFVPGTFGEASRSSITEAIGAWAALAWKQLLLLGLVVAYTLGCRFGLPDETRGREQGAKETIDALSTLYQRSNATDRALQVSMRRADALIRRRLKIGRDADMSAYEESLPEGLLMRMRQAQMLVGEKTPIAFAMQAARRLDQEVNEFVHVKRPRT